jgi:hypothetical protein
MLRKTFYVISICALLFTPFVYSHQLYNGVINTKQAWFYGAMALLLFTAAIDMLFTKKPVDFRPQ